MTNQEHTLLSLSEAAEKLAVSTQTVRRYIAAGHLEAVRLGRRTIRVKAESIESFANGTPVGNWHR